MPIRGVSSSAIRLGVSRICAVIEAKLLVGVAGRTALSEMAEIDCESMASEEAVREESLLGVGDLSPVRALVLWIDERDVCVALEEGMVRELDVELLGEATGDPAEA